MQRAGDQALEIAIGRYNDCAWDLIENIPIDILDEIRNLKVDLILWAMSESNQNASHAAKMLNINRTTMISMLQNELAPILESRKKAAFAAQVNSQEQRKNRP